MVYNGSSSKYGKRVLRRYSEVVVDLYRIGFSTMDIARMFGVDKMSVRGFLKRRGVQLRTGSEAARLSHQREEFRKKMSEITKRAMRDPERRKRRSEIAKKLWREPEFREKMLEIRRSPEYRKKKSMITREQWRDLEFREKVSEAVSETVERLWRDPEFRIRMEKIFQDPEHREKMSEKAKKRWQDPEYIKKALVYKNTSIERRLQNALKEAGVSFRTHEPILGIPDIFIEPNVCVFADGDYWHSRPEQILRDVYVNEELRNRGYIVLRYWEHEIDDEKRLREIVSEIKRIVEGGGVV